MNAASLRSSGAVSSSGRAASTAIYRPSQPLDRLCRFQLPVATRGERAQGRPATRSAGPDGPRSAPSLTDEPPVDTAPPVEAPPPRLNTSNYSAMVAMATAGVVETAYLTYVKLFNGPLVCPTNGCESVLNSPYAQLFGLPLPLYGMLAYGAVGAAAAAVVAAAGDGSAGGAAARRNATLALSAGVAALATTSAVLMSILQTRLGGTPCAWCYLSAALSASLTVTLATSLPGQLIRGSAAAGVVSALATAGLLTAGLPSGSGGGAVYDDNFVLEYRPPLISSPSSERALQLARRLRDSGARMYGAFWCSHCAEQKLEFGGAAMADFPYVECFPNGWRKGEKVAPVCEAAGVRAFPTWVIGGKKLEGQLELGELERELDRAEAAAAPAQAAGAL